MTTVVSSSALVVSSVAVDGVVATWKGGAIPGVVADLQLADFDGDGVADVLATNNDGEGFVHLGQGDGSFGAPVSIGVMNGPAPLIVGDWNADGAFDIAWFETFFEQDTILYYALSASATDSTVVETLTTTLDSGEVIEIKGIIDALGDSYIGVDGVTVFYDSDTLIKFEDDTGGAFAVGQTVEGEGLLNSDGSIYATKLQVGG
jgi:hypothetical protein